MSGIHITNGALMRTLNFNHLYYFWVVARSGSITGASRELHLTQPTLSTQIKHLERELGSPLFARSGRRLVLTVTGRTVMRHAEEMFRNCTELVESLNGHPRAETVSLVLGMSKTVPKLVARSVLDPLRDVKPAVRFVCRERRNELLLEELLSQRLDVMLTDFPVHASAERSTVSCVVGESDVALYAAPDLARRFPRGFPHSTDGAAFVLPPQGNALREQLDGWFNANEIRPDIIAEAEDRAMLNYLGQGGFGILPAAVIIEEEITRQFGVKRIGLVKGARERYYAVALEQRIKHPPVAAIFAAARERYSAQAKAG